MPVHLYEIRKERVEAWVQFEGKRIMPPRKKTLYCMVIKSGAGREIVSFDILLAAGNQPSSLGAMAMNARLFSRIIRRLAVDPAGRWEGGPGNFSMVEGNQVRYHTDCGQDHRFALDDLLDLADIIDGTARFEGE